MLPTLVPFRRAPPTQRHKRHRWEGASSSVIVDLVPRYGKQRLCTILLMMGLRLRKGTDPLLRWPAESFLWMRLMTRLWPLVVLLALLTPSPAAAVSEYHGLVVRFLDGDTIEVLHTQRADRIRLRGIDFLEKGQAFDLLAAPVAVSDTGVVSITRGGAGRVARIRSNTTGVTQPNWRARARTGRQHDEARRASV